MQIILTKERADYFVKELNIWKVEAKVVAEGENWTTIKLPDDLEPDDLANYCFNIGVQYGRENAEN